MVFSQIQSFNRLLWSSLIALITFILLLTPSYSALAAENDVIIATWNIEWFFDADTSDNSKVGQENSPPNITEYQERVNTIAKAISEINPTILALQEVENESVVEDLANRLDKDFNLNYNVAFVQGRDTFTGQDVAYLVKDPLDFEISRFSYPPNTDDSNLKDLSKHALLKTSISGEDFTLVNVHLITRMDNRLKQARTLRAWLDQEMKTSSNTDIIVLGDFNSSQSFNQTTPESEIGIIRGFNTETKTDDFFDVNKLLNPRGTHVSGSELDRVLLSTSSLDDGRLKVKNVEILKDLAIIGKEDQGRGVNYSLPIDEQDLSDHFPLVVTLSIS